ncbi:MAG: phage major capsid protein [Acidobacteriia bacterium]|nr:phage major capsid protein [Terriglobia bacterium]
MKPLERKIEKLGDSLPMLSRDFQILEMVPIKRLTPAEREARLLRRKAKKDAGEPPDPDDDDDETEENSDDTGNEGKEAAGKRDEDRFAISISSEYPVARWFGKEILDHSPEAIDLSRAKLGLSFLDSHDAQSVIGIVEKVKVGDDKKLRGRVRFSRSAPAQQIKTDIQDGIRRFISVGYMVSEYTLEKSSKEEGDTYRATKWMPMEASSVGVPADPTVGNDRKAAGRQYPVSIRSANPASEPNLKEVIVETQTQIAESRTAAAEIIRLGKVHQIDQERVAQAVADGKSVDAFSREVLEEVAKRGAKPLVQPPAEMQDRLDLTAKEQKEYNLARGIMTAIQNIEAASNGGAAKRENSFEMEISQQIEKGWSRESHGGLFVPWSLRHAWNPELQKRFGNLLKTRAGLDSATATAGQELKFTEPGEFIQYLYNTMRVKELGARTIAGLRDNVSYPKQTGKATGSWVGENPGADVADSALTLGSIASSPKTYQSSSSYSRQLLAQAVVDVDTLVREDLARDLALAIDSVAIVGGGANQPTGITATAGVQSYVMISDVGNGGAPAWDDIVFMSEKLEDANADQLGEGAWLTTPGVKSTLKRTARLGNTIGLPIWADDSTVDGYRGRSSNQVTKNSTKGTSGATLHTIVRGIFESMVIGMWGSGFELVVDPYRLKKQGMIELTTFMLTDVTLKYPLAFVVAKYVKTI